MYKKISGGGGYWFTYEETSVIYILCCTKHNRTCESCVCVCGWVDCGTRLTQGQFHSKENDVWGLFFFLSYSTWCRADVRVTLTAMPLCVSL